MTLLPFNEALAQTNDMRRHLLLGNGFSISLFPDRFHYGALLETADFSQIPEAQQAFEVLRTTDFETVVRGLREAAALLSLYNAGENTVTKLEEHACQLKELLVQAIAARHPERPSDVGEEQYRSCRRFLSYFAGESRGKELCGKLYTLNYDLLLYWTLLHDFPAEGERRSSAALHPEWAEGIKHDDGFGEPDGEHDAEYVTWDGESSFDQSVFYLHGALHLFDHGHELQKKCWARSGGQPLIDQIRTALDEERFPLFISEGDTQSKFEHIRHSAYLHKGLRSFRGVCDGKNNSLFIFGHSLAENDTHILKQIEKGRCSKVFVGVYGDVSSRANRITCERARQIATARSERYPLEICFFDAGSAHVWG